MNKITKSLVLLLSFFAVAFGSLQSAYAQCDKNLSGTLTFAQFQAAVDTATYVDTEPGIKICLAPGTIIVNPSSSTVETIKLRKDDLIIIGDKTNPAIIHNQRIGSSLWANTAVTVEKNLVEFAYINIKTDGNYGTGLFLNGARIEKLHDVQILTKGNYVIGMRVESSSATNVVPAGVRYMTDVSITSSGQYGYGLSTVRQAKFSDILRLKIALSSLGSAAVSLFGAEIRSLRDFTFSGGTGISLYMSTDSSIGALERGSITMTEPRTAIYIDASSVALINKVKINNPNSAVSYPLMAFNSQIGDIRNMNFTLKTPESSRFFFSGSQVSLLQNNLTNNGLKLAIYQTNSFIEEQR